MSYFKHTLIGLCMVAAIALTPQVTLAQSSNETRIQLLREIIVLLQAQLELLLEERAQELDRQYPIEDAVFFDDDSFLEGIDAEIVARYSIDDMEISSPSRTHEAYVERLEDLLPEEYHQYFAELVVFESDRDQVDAFVETTLPYNEQWRYGVNEDVFAESLNSILNSELIIHEFAHVFSLHEVFNDSRPRSCHEFFARDGGCVGGDTIYGEFLESFWTDNMLDQADNIRDARNQSRAIDRFYTQYQDEFVSTYAASSPAEDFAESFAHFVLYDDESFGDVADEKTQFFNRFSHTRAMKEEMLSDL